MNTTNNKATFDEIVLAAWLHDVGKFAQRAGMECYCNKKMERDYCKVQKGGWYSHTHALYTAGFLETVKDVFPDGVRPAEIIRLAASHHNPSQYDEWIISRGDRLSSGSDRCNKLTELEAEHSKKFYEKPMLHLLSTLHIQEKNVPKEAYCALEPLENEAVIPMTISTVSREDYERLWKQFEHDFRALQGLKPSQFMKAFDSVLERFWWCIPSSTIDDVDISLYQHAKTTTAFAASLYRFHEKMQTENIEALKDETEKKFLFVNGDMSGIQNYIFDLNTTNDNAKLLRARSFQLWALNQIVAEYIVNQYDLTSANIITSAGGKFILLLPAVSAELISQLQLELERYFWKEFAGKLSFVLSDGVKASGKNVMQENVKKLINDIGCDGEYAKQRKMQKALQKDGAVLNELYSELYKNGHCECCNIFSAQSEKNRICKNCEMLISIGGKLVKSSNVIIQSRKMSHFGQMVHFIKETGDREGCTINIYKPGNSVMYLPYVAPWKNEEKGILKTFEEIAALSKGNKKLAMFKADVDNVGLLFSSSLGSRMSFSRYADISRLLQHFFSAYYVWFIESNPVYKENIYTIFSGGDDLCLLGAWDVILEFGAAFRKQINKLTNDNPSVTFSAGIVLCNSNMPVRSIADMAEKALNASKEREINGIAAKDAVTVFGTTVSWQDYNWCLEKGKKIEKNLSADCPADKKLSAGIVYKMIDFADRAKRVKDGNIRDMIWMSNFRYMVARNIKDEETKKWFSELGTTENIEKSRIAVSYALYAQRNNQEE